jgi:tetratricopeptide (TPR) repeat protein
MPERPFPTTRNYVQSLQGLHRLHSLAVAGQNESPEADAVRDSMDRPWMALTEIEKKRISGLSADLDSIGEPPTEVLPLNPQAQRKLVEACEARQAGEWDKALELLRYWGRYLEPALLSYLRGSIWMEAGDYATAAPFFQHAAQSEPGNANYASLYLYTLWRSDPAAALVRVREVLLAEERHPPAVVVRAAEIRFLSTHGMAAVDSRPVLEDLVRVLERSLARMQDEEARQTSTYALAIALAGFCFDHLGDTRAALRYYNLGLAADPTNDALLVARGILRYGTDSGAAADFQQAIRCGTPVVWPYFFLAHHYLVSNRFDECRRMCECALGMTASDVVRGNLYEWLAISRSELGFPAEQVRAAFEDAIRLETANERIRRNFRAFEESLSRQAPLPRTWEKPVESVVQAFGHAESRPALAA